MTATPTTATAAPATPAAPPTVYKNEAQPDWGLGLVVEDRPDRWVLVFEHGGRRMFLKSVAKTLVPVKVDEDELASLQKLRGRHAPRVGARPAAKKPKKTPALFLSFAEQLAFFEKTFTGGFTDPRFLDEERAPAVEGVKAKIGYKAEAVAMAQTELAKAKFESTPAADLFATAKKIVASTNIVFPIEGAIPFGSIAEADRPAVVAGLQQLLHGEGEFAGRLEKFAGSIVLKDKAGTVKRVSWPLATVFGALFAPAEHVCVKPTYFANQAATLGLPATATVGVTAVAYRQFLDVAKETQKRLLEAGQKPKDLIDVYSFIWRTNKEKAG